MSIFSQKKIVSNITLARKEICNKKTTLNYSRNFLYKFIKKFEEKGIKKEIIIYICNVLKKGCLQLWVNTIYN